MGMTTLWERRGRVESGRWQHAPGPRRTRKLTSPRLRGVGWSCRSRSLFSGSEIESQTDHPGIIEAEFVTRRDVGVVVDELALGDVARFDVSASLRGRLPFEAADKADVVVVD